MNEYTGAGTEPTERMLNALSGVHSGKATLLRTTAATSATAAAASTNIDTHSLSYTRIHIHIQTINLADNNADVDLQ